ncbi:hypothetical protein HYV50_04350 [Candidatus Pacearchaeota archaeon]|nr:hypothetical protein [Candidatus Pacearchaeota archaeon]
MKIKPYLEKLEKSKEYKQFKTKYPDNFLMAGFFLIDLEGEQNVHQVDFYIPSIKKIAAFSLDGQVKFQLLDPLNRKTPEKLDINTKIDLDALPGILSDEMHNRGMSEEIRKIIAIVQNIEGRKIWNLNCVLTGMEILKSHVEDESKTVLKIEKTSLIDLMRRIPAQALMPQTQGQSMPDQAQAQTTEGQENEEMQDSDSGGDEIKKLDALASQIEAEKERLQAELEKKKDAKITKVPKTEKMQEVEKTQTEKNAKNNALKAKKK